MALYIFMALVVVDTIVLTATGVFVYIAVRRFTRKLGHK